MAMQMKINEGTSVQLRPSNENKGNKMKKRSSYHVCGIYGAKVAALEHCLRLYLLKLELSESQSDRRRDLCSCSVFLVQLPMTSSMPER